jgi:hypothetical protein
MKTDNASNRTTGSSEVSWRPFKTARQGAVYGAIIGVIINVLMAGWLLSNKRTPFGGWQKGIEFMIVFNISISLWAAALGMFCAKLPKRIGNGLRFLWALGGFGVGFILPYIIIITLDTSSSAREGAIVMGIVGGGLGLMFAMIGQFAEHSPEKTTGEGKGKV